MSLLGHMLSACFRSLSSSLLSYDISLQIRFSKMKVQTLLLLQRLLGKPCVLQVMREEWTKYLLNKAELQSMKTRNKKVPAGPAPKWAGVMIGEGGQAVYQRGEVRNEQSEELKALAAAADKVALANLEVIGVGDDVTILKETNSRGRGRGRGKGRGGGRGRGRGRGRSEGAGENQKGT
jgi:hypothetical protein